MTQLQELLKWYQEGHQDGDYIETKDVTYKIMELIDNEKPKTFEEACEPLMKWMSENQNPHTMAEVESNRAVLWEGKQTHLTEEFILN